MKFVMTEREKKLRKIYDWLEAIFSGLVFVAVIFLILWSIGIWSL